MARKLCRKLKEYDYLDVKNELRKRARVDKRTGRRPTFGSYLPTDRELQQELRNAPWSVEIEPDARRGIARYRFEEDGKLMNAETDKRKGER